MNQAEAIAALTELLRGKIFPYNSNILELPLYVWLTATPMNGAMQFNAICMVNHHSGLLEGVRLRFFTVDAADASEGVETLEAGTITLDKEGEGSIILPAGKYRVDFMLPEPATEPEPAPGT